MRQSTKCRGCVKSTTAVATGKAWKSAMRSPGAPLRGWFLDSARRGSPAIRTQKFAAFLVVDFEATCNKGPKPPPDPQEIIEFPCLRVRPDNFEISAVFHRYIRPVFHANLSPFCTELTGINQEMVNDQKEFAEVFEDFHRWLHGEQNLGEDLIAFVTCGNWDMGHALRQQCRASEIEVPGHFKRWINVKRSFSDVTGNFPRKMDVMLRHFKLEAVGRPHRGIDDAVNVARIMKEIAKRGHVFDFNSSSSLGLE